MSPTMSGVRQESAVESWRIERREGGLYVVESDGTTHGPVPDDHIAAFLIELCARLTNETPRRVA
jgi:hypothetical protein